MPLTKEQSRLWQAMDIGPQWILRSSEDPLAVADAPVRTVAQPAAERTRTATLRSSPRVVVSAGSPTPPTLVEPGRRSLKPVAAPRPAAPVPVKSAAVVDEALVARVKGASWEEVKTLIAACHACAMSARRTQTVPSDGAPGCPLVLVGEAPGRDEDLEGVPFVGKSGQLLTNILTATGIRRGTDAAVVNVLKCRPPNNRDPLPEEAAACRCFLNRQLELLAPKVMLLLGRTAVKAFLAPEDALLPFARLRGRVFDVVVAGRTVKTMVSYHPSYLLRTPAAKEASWHDLLAVKKLLAGELAASQG